MISVKDNYPIEICQFYGLLHRIIVFLNDIQFWTFRKLFSKLSWKENKQPLTIEFLLIGLWNILSLIYIITCQGEKLLIYLFNA